MERIGKLGEFPAAYGVSDLRAERRGFLNVLSYQPSDLSHRFDLMERGSAAFVLPIDWARREIYLLRAPRHLRAFTRTAEGPRAIKDALAGKPAAAFEAPQDAILVWDVPAGVIEPGESPEAAAIRELEEEAGISIRADRPESHPFEYAAWVYPSVGGTTERLFLTIADVGRNDAVAPKGDGDESMEVWRMSFEEAFTLLEYGGIPNAGGYILLQRLRIMDLERRLASAKG